MKYVIQFDNRFVRVNTQTVSLSRKPVPYISHQKAQEAAKIFRANIAEDITFFQNEIASAKTELTRIQNEVTTLGQELKSAENPKDVDFVTLESKLASLRDQTEAISRAYELAVSEVKYLRKYKPQLVKVASGKVASGKGKQTPTTPTFASIRLLSAA